MKRLLLQRGIWLLSGLMLLAAGEGMANDLGPLQTVNRLPLHLMVLTPRPTRAELPDAGDLETSLAIEYSSVYLDHSGTDWDILMDMEMLILDLSLTYSIGTKMALKLDLPLVSMRDGFLDGFLENYHDAIGAPNYGREDRPDDTFGYQATRNGNIWIDGESDSFNLADITLSAQFEWMSKTIGRRTMTRALLFSLKLPTGDEETGMGSGGYDMGLYVPMQWSGTPWSFYLMPGAALISDPESTNVNVASRNSYSLFAGTAYDYSERLRLLAQLNFHTSPFERFGSSKLDNGALELSLGFQRRMTPRMHMEFAFSEDLTRAAPDFNVRLGLVWTSRLKGAKQGG